MVQARLFRWDPENRILIKVSVAFHSLFDNKPAYFFLKRMGLEQDKC